MSHEQVIIIGSGPAGHSAAIYCSRAELNPLMLEGFLVGGVGAGGQLTITTEVENYAGFPRGIDGPELMVYMRKQSLRFGTRIVTKTVSEVDLATTPFKVITEDGQEHHSETVIIATGAIARRLGLPGEEEYWQKGISACAVCDGALPIYRNQPLMVVGGGDSACEEALFLTKYGEKVWMVVRRDMMRASKVMQKRVSANPKIEVLWNTVGHKIIGDGELLTAVETRNVKSDQQRPVKVRGLFYAIGHTPNTGFLRNQLEIDDAGYIVTQPGTTITSVPGVFAAGDVQDRRYRQAITAAGTGCMAALEVERFLSARQ